MIYNDYVARRRDELQQEDGLEQVYDAECHLAEIYPEILKEIDDAHTLINTIKTSPLWMSFNAPQQIDFSCNVQYEDQTNRSIARAARVSQQHAVIEIKQSHCDYLTLFHELVHCISGSFAYHNVLFRKAMCLMFEFFFDRQVGQKLHDLYKQHGLTMSFYPILTEQQWNDRRSRLKK